MSSTQSPVKRVIIAYPSKVPPAKRAKVETREFPELVVAYDQHTWHECLREKLVDTINEWATWPKGRNQRSQSRQSNFIVDPVELFQWKLGRERASKYGDIPLPKQVVAKAWESAKNIAAQNQTTELWDVPRPVPNAEKVNELITRVLDVVGESKDPVSEEQVNKAEEEHSRRLRAQMPASPPSIE